ncbi:MAG: HetP family heterocyst commitment protein [Cyanobacteriota bacterium]
MNSNLSSRLDKAMSPDQFNQVVEAILEGKYSWACLLILQFAGYNPLHYIPYRTYNRLMKENNSRKKPKTTPEPCKGHRPEETLCIQDCITRLEDLGYLESLKEAQAEVHGGDRPLSSDRPWLRTILWN